jgi:hypothetical protein
VSKALQNACEAPGLLGRPAECRHGAAYLGPGPLERLAVLAGDRPGDRVGVVGQAAAHRVQGRGPDVRRQRGGLVGDGGGPRHGALDLLGGGQRGLADRPPVGRVGHRQKIVAGLGTAGDVERGGRHGAKPI